MKKIAVLSQGAMCAAGLRHPPHWASTNLVLLQTATASAFVSFVESRVTKQEHFIR